jgi:quercetin dioxygenase-like cupin family protein
MPKPLIPSPHLDAGFSIARWARDAGLDGEQMLAIGMGLRPVPISKSSATGEALVSNGAIGADIIRLEAGQGLAPHTHPGDHLLIMLGGAGTITIDGTVRPTHAGEMYIVSGEIPHAVGAITDHVILSVGAPHRAIDAPDRMELVAYDAVLSEFSDLHCLICDLRASAPERLHDAGCPHCPCGDCHPGTS